MKVTKTASGKKTLKISKREWESIGKIAGWGDKNYDDYDISTTSPASKTIELMNPSNIQDTIEVGVLVDFSVEPTEYEGSYLFYQGGIVINEVKTEEPVILDGKEYPAGTNVEQLVPFFANQESFDSYINGLKSELDDEVKIPEKRYPMTR